MKMGPKTVTGDLAEDPTWRTNQNNEPFLTMKLLETQRVLNRETRKWEDSETTQYDIAVKDPRMAQNIANSVRTGDRLTVAGSYTVEPFVTKNGDAKMNHRIWANEVAASLRFTEVQVPERETNQSRGPQVENSVQSPQQTSAAAQSQPGPAQAGGFPAPVQSQQPTVPQPSAGAQWGNMMAEKFQRPPASQSGTSGPGF